MYHYTTCGLDNIYLSNGYQESESLEGKGISIHNLDGLHMAIGKGISTQAARISGKAFRFLCIELDLSQKAIGALMEKTDQTIAKWEKGDIDIPILADKAIRDLYMEYIDVTPISGLLAELSDLDRRYHEFKFNLEETTDGWQLDECA